MLPTVCKMSVHAVCCNAKASRAAQIHAISEKAYISHITHIRRHTTTHTHTDAESIHTEHTLVRRVRACSKRNRSRMHAKADRAKETAAAEACNGGSV